MDDRLYRSRDERMIAGVAGGLAERLDLDPSLVRIIWAVLVLPTGFLALLVYVVMAIVVPEEPPAEAPLAEAPAAAGEAAREAPTAPAWADARVQRRAGGDGGEGGRTPRRHPRRRGPPLPRPPAPARRRLRPPLAGRAHRARSRPRPRLGTPRVNRARSWGVPARGRPDEPRGSAPASRRSPA